MDFRTRSSPEDDFNDERHGFDMLMHTFPEGGGEKDAAFRQYYSCVDFTFQQNQNRANARRLVRLNGIFERAADRRSGGIREEKLLRILPPGTAAKLGMDTGSHDKKSSQKCKDHSHRKYRVVSRGTFLAMFCNESSTFMNTMILKDKADREKRLRKKHARKSGSTAKVLSSVALSNINCANGKEIKKRKKKQKKGKRRSNSGEQDENISRNSNKKNQGRKKSSREEQQRNSSRKRSSSRCKIRGKRENGVERIAFKSVQSVDVDAPSTEEPVMKDFASAHIQTTHMLLSAEENEQDLHQNVIPCFTTQEPCTQPTASSKNKTVITGFEAVVAKTEATLSGVNGVTNETESSVYHSSQTSLSSCRETLVSRSVVDGGINHTSAGTPSELPSAKNMIPSSSLNGSEVHNWDSRKEEKARRREKKRAKRQARLVEVASELKVVEEYKRSLEEEKSSHLKNECLFLSSVASVLRQWLPGERHIDASVAPLAHEEKNHLDQSYALRHSQGRKHGWKNREGLDEYATSFPPDLSNPSGEEILSSGTRAIPSINILASSKKLRNLR